MPPGWELLTFGWDAFTKARYALSGQARRINDGLAAYPPPTLS
jgi:hypothetical protein